MKKPRMIKQRWVIVSIIVLVIVVVLGAIYLLQQENIKAAANAKRYTQQQLREQLEESRQGVEAVLTEQYPGLQVRDLTNEERTALRQGELSITDLVDILTGGGSSQASGQGHSDTEDPAPTQAPATAAPGQTSPPATAAPASTPSGTAPTAAPSPSPSASPPPPAATPDPDEEYKTELAKIIAEVYILREEFTARLQGMVAAAKAEYQAMPESERTKSKLISWAAGYAETASVMEKECDAQMLDIIARLKELVAQYREDDSIVSTLIDSYALEKSIQKSLYIQELEKRGIM